MFRRGEPVPFAFVAEADWFQSNVTPPPPSRPSRSQLALRALGTLGVVGGLLLAVAVGGPALDPGRQGGISTQQSEAAQGR